MDEELIQNEIDARDVMERRGVDGKPMKSVEGGAYNWQIVVKLSKDGPSC
jgi:hypothetical protein